MAKQIPRYVPAPSPKIDRSTPIYLERELQRIKETLDEMADAIEKLQNP